MAVELGTGFVSIVPSGRGFGAALDKQVAGPSALAGDKAGKSFSSKFGGGLKSLGKAAAVGFTAVGAVAIGAAAGLYKIGEAFDDSYDKIRVGTGATGLALEGLKADFKAVSTAVPASFEDASTAIADLNTRLGLTGKPLQDLSGQFLELSRITETDLSTNIDSLTRVFGDWQISTDQMPESLDKVYRASQASGIGLDDLSQSVVQFGAPLRNLGFDFDSSLALLAQFNKTGVNTSTVFAGLKAGVGKLAKAGEPVPETFKRVVGEITKLGPGTAATAKAIELFGQRAGPDLADAIAGGKFEVTGMLDAISNGSDTIMQAGKDTMDFSEQWKMLKNKVLVGLEPIASKVFGAIGDGMAYLSDVVGPKLPALFDKVGPAIASVGVTVGPIFDLIKEKAGQFLAALQGVDWAGVFADAKAFIEPIVESFVKLAGAVIDFAVAAWPKVQSAIATALPVIKEVATVLAGALTTAVSFLADNMDTLAPALIAAGGAFAAFKAAKGVASTFSKISDSASKAKDGFKKAGDAASKAAAPIKKFFQPGGGSDTVRLRAMQAADGVKKAGAAFKSGAKNATDWAAAQAKAGAAAGKAKIGAFASKLKDVAGALKSGGTAAATWAKNMALSAAATIKDTAAKVAAKIAQVAMTVAQKAAAIAQWALNAAMSANPITLVVLAIGALVAALVLAYTKVGWFRDFVDAAFRLIKTVAVSVFNGIKSVITTVVSAIATVITTYANIYKTVFTTAFNIIKTVVTTVVNAVQSVISTVFGAIKAVFSTVLGAIKSIVTTYFNAYKSIVSTVFNAIKSVASTVWNGIKSTISSVVGGIRTVVSTGFNAVKGFITKPIEAAKSTVSTVLDGIKRLFSDLPGKLSGALSSLASMVAAPFKAMGRAIKDAWNNSVGGKGFTIPDIPGVPGRGKRVEIPKLHTGGPVTGPPGSEHLRILEAGEWVLTGQQFSNAMAATSAVMTAPPSGRAGVEFSGDLYLSDEVDVDMLDRKMTFAQMAMA